MNKTLMPGIRSGEVKIPSSKFVVHRLLICAALGTCPVTLYFDGLSDDILATVRCLDALGAEIAAEENRIRINPILRSQTAEKEAVLPAGESGSTLRFLLPIVGALGRKAVFLMQGRLPDRPLAPYDRILTEHGMRIQKEGNLLHCDGTLHGGAFSLPGNISSQYFSGLLMALPLLQEDSTITAEGVLESAGYISLTEDAMTRAGLQFTCECGKKWNVPGRQRPSLPDCVEAEGDWSNAAFFLCMGAFSEKGIRVKGLSTGSRQGDRAILDILKQIGADVEENTDNLVSVRKGSLKAVSVCAQEIPDLVPALAVLLCAAEGESRIYGASRLRLKESDRLNTTAELICSLGGQIAEEPDGLRVTGTGKLIGGAADARNDHRIAMSAALASCFCSGQVSVKGADCVKKSYPAFWRDFEKLSCETVCEGNGHESGRETI